MDHRLGSSVTMIMTTIPLEYNALYSARRLVVQEEMPELAVPFFEAVDRLARGEAAAAAEGTAPPDAIELLRIAERLGSVQIVAPPPMLGQLLALLYLPASVVFTKE
jgi:hypothetical protein